MSRAAELLFPLLPALALLWIVWRTDREREPPLVILGTALLAAVFGAAAQWLIRKAMVLTSLDVDVHVAGQGMALLFLFAFVAPLGEAAKVAALWPAFRSRHFDEPYDGVVYASASALGFAVVEGFTMLHAHGASGVWIARALLALPAHVFFAALWGWGLGRARQLREPGAQFPLLFLFAVIGHGVYTHLVFARGPTAMVTVLPLLGAMGVVAFFLARDLRRRNKASSSSRITRLSIASLEALSKPPSLRAFREALKKRDRPILWRWVLMGGFVHVGGMVLGLVGAVAFGHFVQMDFSIVDEHDVSTAGPVALLIAGLLAGFPLAGYVIAKAGELTSLFESAASSVLSIVATLVLLGLVAPVALVFALALAPLAFGLSCAGAWVGRTDPG
jgi:RsiW-degrading membrane proteinase PrsW (M82 family)